MSPLSYTCVYIYIWTDIQICIYILYICIYIVNDNECVNGVQYHTHIHIYIWGLYENLITFTHDSRPCASPLHAQERRCGYTGYWNLLSLWQKKSPNWQKMDLAPRCGWNSSTLINLNYVPFSHHWSVSKSQHLSRLSRIHWWNHMFSWFFNVCAGVN